MSTTGLDEWTEEKCLQLIREYRARPILWDPKNPLYFVRGTKLPVWEDLAAAVNSTAERCKHKMIILCSSFRREKSKIVHSLKNLTDSSQAYKSTWFAFKEMAFLLDKETERKRQLNDSDETDEDDDNAANVELRLLQNLKATGHTRKKARVNLTQEILTSKTSKLEGEEPAAPQIRSSPCRILTKSEREEEIKSFVTFIGSKMKKYSESTKNAVQKAICDIIFEADQNYYENISYEKCTIIDEKSDPLNEDHDENETITIKYESE